VLVFVLRSSPTPHRSATAAAASASPSPSPTPMSPEQYQKVLDDLARSLGAKFGALGADRTPDQLRMDVVSMRDELSGSFNILQTATPPPQVRPAHDQLLTALTQLSEIVNEVVTAAGNAELCGGSSALSRITTSPAADAVRTAIKGLSTADPTHPYPVAAFLPTGTPEANRQLGNGAVIKKSTKGPNTLKVEDNGDTDAVLTLAPAGSTSTSLMVYVRAGQTATTNGVKDGSYDMYVASGHDWDGGAKAFTRNCAYEKFTDPADFSSTKSTYTILTITLHASSGGNASATPTDPGSFPT